MQRLKTAKFLSALALLASMTLVGCGPPKRFQAVQDSYVQVEDKKEAVFRVVANALLENNFSITNKDEDLGVLMTDWVKFGEVGDKPPFDWFMQIKARVTVDEQTGKVAVKLTPVGKAVNRLNPNAFSPLSIIYDDEVIRDRDFYGITLKKNYSQAMMIYRNVVQLLEQDLKLTPGSMEHALVPVTLR